MMEIRSKHIKAESEEMDSSDFEGQENDVLENIHNEMLIEDDRNSREGIINTEE